MGALSIPPGVFHIFKRGLCCRGCKGVKGSVRDVTRDGLASIVAGWQGRLGLAHWDFQVRWDEPCAAEADAATEYSLTYDRAWLCLDAGWADWSVEFANRIVVHELLHLLFRDVDRAVASLDGLLSREAAGLFEARFDHECEGLVDRLAVRLVEIGGVLGDECLLGKGLM